MVDKHYKVWSAVMKYFIRIKAGDKIDKCFGCDFVSVTIHHITEDIHQVIIMSQSINPQSPLKHQELNNGNNTSDKNLINIVPPPPPPLIKNTKTKKHEMSKSSF